MGVGSAIDAGDSPRPSYFLLQSGYDFLIGRLDGRSCCLRTDRPVTSAIQLSQDTNIRAWR